MQIEPPPDLDDELRTTGIDDSDTESARLVDAREIMLWREYQHLTSLYVSYLDLVVKASVGVVFIVATITTLVLANAEKRPEIVWSLLPLSVLCIGVAWAATKSIVLVRELRGRVQELASDLEIGLAPHVEILIYGAHGAAILAASTAVLLLALATFLHVT